MGEAKRGVSDKIMTSGACGESCRGDRETERIGIVEQREISGQPSGNGAFGKRRHGSGPCHRAIRDSTQRNFPSCLDRDAARPKALAEEDSPSSESEE
ncbi:unnamed protein product [Lampetra planeri]